jgi:hypothetical protein
MMMIRTINEGDGSHPCCLVLLWPPPFPLFLPVADLSRLRGDGSSGDCHRFTSAGEEVEHNGMAFHYLHIEDLVL